MKKSFLILIISLLLISCKSNYEFTGVWFNEENWNDGFLVIEKIGDNYIVYRGNEKFVGKIEENIITINEKGNTVNLTIDRDNNLIFDGETLIKEADDINSLLNPKKISDKTFSTSEIKVRIKDNNDVILLSNGDRLYSFNGAKKAANYFPGWRLPTYEDFRQLKFDSQIDTKKIMKVLNPKNQYGYDGKISDGDKEVIGSFWTSTSKYSGGKFKTIISIIENKDGTKRYRENSDFDSNFYFSVILIKE